MNITHQTNSPLTQTDYHRMLLQGDCIRRTYGPTAHRLYTEHVLDPAISRSTFSASKKEWWNDRDTLIEHLSSLEVQAFNARNHAGLDDDTFPDYNEEPADYEGRPTFDDDLDEDDQWLRDAKFS